MEASELEMPAHQLTDRRVRLDEQHRASCCGHRANIAALSIRRTGTR
jgi:hypothetical protein